MGNNGLDLGGAVPLGRGAGQAVNVREQRIIVPGTIEARPGGLSQADCGVHIRIVDVPSGVAWLYPHRAEFMRELARSLITICDDVTSQQHR